MKLLLENWRKYLNGELGKQVWARQAPPESRHAGTEKDTRREKQLLKAFLAYIVDNVSPAISSKDID